MHRNPFALAGGAVVALVVVLVVAVAAGYVIFGSFLVVSDHATYHSNATHVDDVDYDAVVANAETAGYDVDTYWVNAKQTPGPGVHPDGLPELSAAYGESYRVRDVDFPYDDPRGGGEGDLTMSAGYDADGDSRVALVPEGPAYAVDPDELPSEEWLRTRLTLAFEIDDRTAAAYVTDLKLAAREGEDTPRVSVTEPPSYATVHRHLTERATNVTTTKPRGEGTFQSVFLEDGDVLARVTYVVPNSEIVHREGNVDYEVKLDRLGGTYLRVTLPAGAEVPEATYRETFREMFADLGLDPAVVDRFTFEYTAGNW